MKKVKDSSYKKLFELEKYKDLYDFSSLECRIAVIGVILLDIVFAVCSFSVGVDETVIKAVSLLDDIGIALIGYIGFTVSALAILTGAISSKVVNIIKTRNKMVVLERILLSFYLMGIVCAAVVLVALILHFIVEIPVASIFIINLIGISILSYFIIFILFYSVKLIGNCLELFYIVNGYELLDEEKTDYKAIYNNYRITAIEKVNLSNTSIEKVNEYKEVAVINRLDRPVSGLVLFAKNKKEASRLSSLMQEEGFCKQYYAVCCGKLPDKNGEFVDYLLKDGKNNVSKVVKEGTAGAKYAKLLYETLKEIEKDDKVYTLVKVTLITGRHHQIRVQFAHRNHPLLGDTKYGDERFNNEIALCAAFLSVDGHEYSIEPSWQF